MPTLAQAVRRDQVDREGGDDAPLVRAHGRARDGRRRLRLDAQPIAITGGHGYAHPDVHGNAYGDTRAVAHTLISERKRRPVRGSAVHP